MTTWVMCLVSAMRCPPVMGRTVHRFSGRGYVRGIWRTPSFRDRRGRREGGRRHGDGGSGQAGQRTDAQRRHQVGSGDRLAADPDDDEDKDRAAQGEQHARAEPERDRTEAVDCRDVAHIENDRRQLDTQHQGAGVEGDLQQRLTSNGAQSQTPTDHDGPDRRTAPEVEQGHQDDAVGEGDGVG